jgi:hypothetical protein
MSTEKKFADLEHRMDRIESMLQNLTSEISQVKSLLENLTGPKSSETPARIKKESEYTPKKIAQIEKVWSANEYIIEYNFEYIGEKYFKHLGEYLELNTKVVTHKPEERSFGVIAVYDEAVIVTDATFDPEYVYEFIEFIKSNRFYDFFPKYKGKKLIPIFGSFHITEDILALLTENKIYAMGLKNDEFVLINFEELQGVKGDG